MSSGQSNKDAILQELASQSQLFAEEATLLSSLLIRVEEFFLEMPGKVAISTDGAGLREYELSFRRQTGDWRLVLERRQEGNYKTYLVSEASIMQKAEAAKLLPELYTRLKDHFSSGRAEIASGLASLRSLPFLDLDDWVATNDSDIEEKGA